MWHHAFHKRNIRRDILPSAEILDQPHSGYIDLGFPRIGNYQSAITIRNLMYYDEAISTRRKPILSLHLSSLTIISLFSSYCASEIHRKIIRILSINYTARVSCNSIRRSSLKLSVILETKLDCYSSSRSMPTSASGICNINSDCVADYISSS